MNCRIWLIVILVLSVAPAHAEQASSDGEAIHQLELRNAERENAFNAQAQAQQTAMKEREAQSVKLQAARDVRDHAVAAEYKDAVERAETRVARKRALVFAVTGLGLGAIGLTSWRMSQEDEKSITAGNFETGADIARAETSVQIKQGVGIGGGLLGGISLLVSLGFLVD